MNPNTEALLKERNTILRSIELQKKNIISEMNKLGDKIDEDSEIEFYNDLAITTNALLFKEKIRNIMVLTDQEIQTYKEYTNKLLDLPQEEITETNTDDYEVPPEAEMSEKEIEDFIEKVRPKVIELKILQKNNPKQAKGKYASLFRMGGGTFKEQRKEIIQRILQEEGVGDVLNEEIGDEN